MREATYQKFYEYLQELLQSHLCLSALLGEKIQAVSEFDLDKLDSILKQEQAYVLQARGFENALAGFREKLGLPCQTLREAIPLLPLHWQQPFRLLSEDLRSSLEIVQELNAKCQTLLETKLHTLGKTIQELDRSNPRIYNKAVSRGNGSSPHILTKSI